VEDSILFDGTSVGRGAEVRRAILDKRVQVGPGARIGFDPDKDRRRGFVVSDGGIACVPKESIVEVGLVDTGGSESAGGAAPGGRSGWSRRVVWPRNQIVVPARERTPIFPSFCRRPIVRGILAPIPASALPPGACLAK
jgi:hypothetical protein